MWPNAATGTMTNSGAKFGYRLASFFGKVNYNWDDLLLASFTIRYDGSSRFGKAHRWGTFPAASLGFRFSNLLKRNGLTMQSCVCHGDRLVIRQSTTTHSLDFMSLTTDWTALHLQPTTCSCRVPALSLQVTAPHNLQTLI